MEVARIWRNQKNRYNPNVNGYRPERPALLIRADIGKTQSQQIEINSAITNGVIYQVPVGVISSFPMEVSKSSR